MQTCSLTYSLLVFWTQIYQNVNDIPTADIRFNIISWCSSSRQNTIAKSPLTLTTTLIALFHPLLNFSSRKPVRNTIDMFKINITALANLFNCSGNSCIDPMMYPNQARLIRSTDTLFSNLLLTLILFILFIHFYLLPHYNRINQKGV